MRIGVLRETAEAERRVSATPETVKKLIALGAEVSVEVGAGAGAAIPDAAYVDAGATLTDRAALMAGADLIFAVQAPDSAPRRAPRHRARRDHGSVGQQATGSPRSPRRASPCSRWT